MTGVPTAGRLLDGAHRLATQGLLDRGRCRCVAEGDRHANARRPHRNLALRVGLVVIAHLRHGTGQRSGIGAYRQPRAGREGPDDRRADDPDGQSRCGTQGGAGQRTLIATVCPCLNE